MCLRVIGPTGRQMFGVQDPGPGKDCKLYELSSTGEIMLHFVLTGFDEIKAIAFDHDSSPFFNFYAVDTPNERLITIDAANGNTTDIGPTADARGMIWIGP